MSNITIRAFDTLRVAAMAVFVLLLGVGFYWVTRPHGSAAFLSLLPEFPLDQHSTAFSQWLGWLPTFIHVFAFSLLTYLALGRRHLLFACILWGGINALFELGQALPPRLIWFIPDLFNIRAYFTNGVFDLFDLGACVIGAWVAWAVCRNRALHNGKNQPGTDREYFSRNGKKCKSIVEWQ